MPEKVERFIIKHAQLNHRGKTTFQGSYHGAESLYDKLSTAKGQAREVGDQVYSLDLTNLGSSIIVPILVFTRT